MQRDTEQHLCHSSSSRNSAELVEVRTPTYMRPSTLAVALSSLRAQTWTNWKCYVFDDSPDEESLKVCKSFRDSRISHSFNRPQKYAARNIDGSFLIGDPDATYGFILEDDNALFPQFIEHNIRDLKRAGANILLRNQVVAFGNELTKLTVLENRFTEGLYKPLELLVAIFFSPVISNGGLFWSRAAKTNLSVGHDDCGASIQEYLRALSLQDDVYVAIDPLAIFTVNGSASMQTLGTSLKKRQIARSRQLIRQAVYDVLKDTGNLDLLASPRVGSKSRTHRGVLVARRPWKFRREASLEIAARAMAKSWCLSLVPIESSLPEFLSDFRRRAQAT